MEKGINILLLHSIRRPAIRRPIHTRSRRMDSPLPRMGSRCTSRNLSMSLCQSTIPALAGMILGIAGLFLSFFGLVPLLGLIFSIIGMRSVTRKGMAIAGLVTSIIGLVAAVFFTILIVGLIIAAANTPTY